ncbi:MAG: apolipoprotein N-acyltransferase [Planctomycetes bacterium]|nr:apolipoprotein N-acyltransferase [Planctomycetota bacterium]
MDRRKQFADVAYGTAAAAAAGMAVLLSGYAGNGGWGMISGLWGAGAIACSGALWGVGEDAGGTRMRIAWSIVYSLIVMEYVRTISFLLWPAAALYLVLFYVAAAMFIRAFRPASGLWGVAVFSLVGFIRIELLAGPGRAIVETGGAHAAAATGLALPFGDPVYGLAGYPASYGMAAIAGTTVALFAWGACGYAAYRAISGKRYKLLWIVAGSAISIILAGWISIPRSAPAGSIRVLSIQGDVRMSRLEQLPEPDDAQRDPLAAHLSELTETGLGTHPETELVVWPESSIQDMIMPGLRPVWLKLPGERTFVSGCYSMREAGTGLVVGTAALVCAQDKTLLNNKVVLTPFGEYSPWRLGRIAGGAQGDESPDLGPGDWQQPTFSVNGFRLGTLVCYEDAFPGRLAAEVAKGAQAAIVVSNDGWFRGSTEPRQHAAALRVRALEAGLPVVRASNVRPSMILDRTGRVLAVSEAGPSTLYGELPVYSGRRRTTGICGWIMLLAITAAVLAESMQSVTERRPHGSPSSER